LKLLGYQKDSNFWVIRWHKSCIFRTTNATFSCRMHLNGTISNDTPGVVTRELFMKWIQNLLGFFYDILFGCRHWSQTRPFTLEQQTYKVCLDCGKQIYYSTERMTPLSAREVRRMKAATTAPITVISTSMNAGGFLTRRANKSNAAA
jgi:hypothetical protein